MPLYDYVCTQCGRRDEVMHGVHAPGPEHCAACGGPLRKALSLPAIVFKGTGWAKKDARSAQRGSSAGEGSPGKDGSKEGGEAKDGKAAKDGKEDRAGKDGADSGAKANSAKGGSEPAGKATAPASD
jgi:putative FmdB family regulatory protein